MLRNDPMNNRADALNKDRKVCLNLVYEMVNAWEDLKDESDAKAFEKSIREEFGLDKLHRILSICMFMDRAQSLYRMQIPTSIYYGMHWYSKSHLDTDSPEAQYVKEKYPEKYTVLQSALEELKKVLEDYPGSPTMNRRLYKIIHTPSFGFLEDETLWKLSVPVAAEFIEKQEDTEMEDACDGRRSTEETKPSPTLQLIQNQIEETLNLFVQKYDEPQYQERLNRIYKDRSSHDPEEWAHKLYLTFRDDNSNPRALGLNQDRKACLNLLYDLVNAWEYFQFSSAFEEAMLTIFKPHRMARILGVCLVMDRAQSLYKMVLPAISPKGEMIIGMHWFSDLHFQNSNLSPEEHEEWRKLLEKYSGTATMNKRLYRLLYSEKLDLRKDPVFAKWSHPQPATFVYRAITKS
ncbi:hypothetical protein ACA910_004381 [Epithemia clementina (nom. ined.)]